MRLGGHVADRVIRIALALSIASCEARELAKRVVRENACQSRAVLGAALARHAPRQVVGIGERQIIRARGGLRYEVAHFIVGVGARLLRTLRGDPAAQGVIAVAGGLAVYTLDRDKAVHGVVGIGDLLAVRVGHRGAVAVAVVGVAHRLAVGLGDGVAEGVRLAGEVAERVVGIILLEVRQGNSPVPLF